MARDGDCPPRLSQAIGGTGSLVCLDRVAPSSPAGRNVVFWFGGFCFPCFGPSFSETNWAYALEACVIGPPLETSNRLDCHVQSLRLVLVH